MSWSCEGAGGCDLARIRTDVHVEVKSQVACIEQGNGLTEQLI